MPVFHVVYLQSTLLHLDVVVPHAFHGDEATINVLRNVPRDCNFVFFSINSGRRLVTKESRGARIVDVLELINILLSDRVFRQVPMSVI